MATILSKWFYLLLILVYLVAKVECKMELTEPVTSELSKVDL